MAVPKRRTSKTRRNKRRAHWKLALPGLVKCSHCREAKLAHRVCPSCGYYKDKEIVPKQ